MATSIKAALQDCSLLAGAAEITPSWLAQHSKKAVVLDDLQKSHGLCQQEPWWLSCSVCTRTCDQGASLDLWERPHLPSLLHQTLCSRHCDDIHLALCLPVKSQLTHYPFQYKAPWIQATPLHKAQLLLPVLLTCVSKRASTHSFQHSSPTNHTCLAPVGSQLCSHAWTPVSFVVCVHVQVSQMGFQSRCFHVTTVKASSILLPCRHTPCSCDSTILLVLVTISH